MTLRIIHNGPVSSFATEWIAPIIQQYISFEPWDPEKTYPPHSIFYTNCRSSQSPPPGFRIIVDNLWEVNPGVPQSGLRLCCDRWFWYNESLWYRYLGYDQYQPRPQYHYQALMPINRHRPHRQDFVSRVDLSRMLWSSVEAGRQLPGDKDMSDARTQRYMNPDWYDQCYVSMVVETLVQAGSKYTPVFITEKTMKPLAFQHPFVVYGNRNTLSTLHSWGFETWDHLWDESYDSVVSTEDRRDAVIKTLHSIEIQQHSTETQKRLAHNKNHFFDQQRVRQGIISEIVEPILEYAETHL